MTFDKFTIKAQEVVQEALNTAQRSGQQSIEPMHLLKALLVKAKDVTTFIFQKLGVNAMQVESVTDAELQRLPRVQGGQPYLSNDTNAVCSVRRTSPRRTATSSRASNPSCSPSCR